MLQSQKEIMVVRSIIMRNQSLFMMMQGIV